MKKQYYVYITRVATYRVEADSAESAKDIALSGDIDAGDEDTIDVWSEPAVRNTKPTS